MNFLENLIPKSIRSSIYHFRQIRKIRGLFNKVSIHTMLSPESFETNLLLASRIHSVKGDIVECGVWKGGMSAGMAMFLGNSRSYWLYDSFEGLPDAKEIDGETAITWQQDKEGDTYFDNCTANERNAIEIMELSGVERVRIIKGWFNETLNSKDGPKEIALLRLDGDWYDSTMDCLEALFPKVVKGGMIIIDDYYTWDGCAKAVHDFLSKYQLPLRIKSMNNVAFIRK